MRGTSQVRRPALCAAVVAVAVVVLAATGAWAQPAGGGPSSPAVQDTGADPGASVATPTGHEVRVGIGGYSYTEPEDVDIRIHGPRLVLEYSGTWSLDQRRRWLMEVGARGSGGIVAYDGWCRPWLIRPDAGSANGYALGLGPRSPCSFSGDGDVYGEGRALIGKDLLTGRWGVSPASGLGVRFLSNGTTGVRNFRTDTYLYVPLGVTVRTPVGSGRRVSLNVEYDHLLRGWQTTRQSQLGGGRIGATATAPAFTIDGFTDFSFPQHRGWGLRAGMTYELTRRWSITPRFIHWSVSDSEVAFSTVTFTVNGLTATQELAAVEPLNRTEEWTVHLGFRF